MKTTVIAVSLCLLTAAVVVLNGPARSQQGYKSFQLVYHSDTRGYYLPCG
jgi:hypothetical protein